MAKKPEKNERKGALAISQGFVIERWHRSDIHGVDYNPRKISDAARRKLKASLEANKLVAPITVNRNGGKIVGGHQRLSCIDSIEKTKDYLLDVAVIDVSEEEEKRLNVALNNQSIQGSWDIELLGELVIGSEDLDLASMGFDDADIFKMLGDTSESQSSEKLLSLGQKIRESRDLYTEIAKKNASKNDDEFYCVMVFRSMVQRDEFLKLAELPKGRYQSGEEFMRILSEGEYHG